MTAQLANLSQQMEMRKKALHGDKKTKNASDDESNSGGSDNWDASDESD